MMIIKPKHFSELGSFDISPIKKMLNQFPISFWDIEDKRKENNFIVFHHTQHIIFSFISGNLNHQKYYSNPLWDIWRSSLEPIMDAIIRSYNFETPIYPKVMLSRLKAGSFIDMHIDGNGSNLHTHKIHIPIETNHQSIFKIKKESKHLREGFAYEVNNIIPHGAENFGSTDRIHLIFEVFDQSVQ